MLVFLSCYFWHIYLCVASAKRVWYIESTQWMLNEWMSRTLHHNDWSSQKIIEMGTGHKEVSHEMRNKYRQMVSLHTEVELTNTGAAPPQILLLGERRFFFLSGGFLVCLFCCCYLQSPWSIIWYQEWTITGNWHKMWKWLNGGGKLWWPNYYRLRSW